VKDTNKVRVEEKCEAAPEGASSVLEHRPKKVPSKSEKKASSIALDNLNVQLGDIDAFTPSYNDSEAHGGYNRQTPDRFSGERDDSLMRSLIQDYAIELKDGSGAPSGNFFLNQEGARGVCNEVLTNNQHLSSAKATAFLD